MAFVIAKELEPDQQDVTLPATITFSATIRDDEATGTPAPSALVLRLAKANKLSFSPGALVKVKPFSRAIPANDKDFLFTATIHGDSEGLLSFRVALVLPDGQETGCLVHLA